MNAILERGSKTFSTSTRASAAEAVVRIQQVQQRHHKQQIMRMACIIVIDSSQCSRVPTAFNPPKLRWYCEPTICRDKRHAVKSS
jgi:hypothetical protein